MANIVLLLAHAVEEHDMVQLLSELGHNVFSIGAYSNPAAPGVDIRPALPDVPYFPDLEAACHEQRVRHEGQTHDADGRDVVDWAKRELPDAVLEWADVVIVHHLEHTWLVPDWPRLRASGKRIVWRSVGQSVAGNEAMMAPLRAEGLERVTYSPKEHNIPGFSGETALIRFWKDPDEFGPWTGDIPAVINITQQLRQRDPYTNWRFWDAATTGLPRIAMGPGSEVIGGTGELTYPKMKEMLRRARCYLYTGTQPASYTLGLIEAMMSGTPVVSIGPAWMDVFPYGPSLFEGHEVIPSESVWHDDPVMIRGALGALLQDRSVAADWSDATRARAIDLFGKAKIAEQWREFLA